MTDEDLGTLIVLGVGIAAVVGIGFWVVDAVESSAERDNVRACLEQSPFSRHQRTVLSEVVNVEVLGGFDNGSFLRSVDYLVLGSGTVQSIYCTW